MGVAYVNLRSVKERVWSMKTRRGVAWDRVVEVEDVAQRMHPEKFWERGADQGSSKVITYCTICTLSNSIQLGAVRQPRYVRDTILKEIRFKFV